MYLVITDMKYRENHLAHLLNNIQPLKIGLWQNVNSHDGNCQNLMDYKLDSNMGY